jgi:hypothetical protein
VELDFEQAQVVEVENRGQHGRLDRYPVHHSPLNDIVIGPCRPQFRVWEDSLGKDKTGLECFNGPGAPWCFSAISWWMAHRIKPLYKLHNPGRWKPERF